MEVVLIGMSIFQSVVCLLIICLVVRGGAKNKENDKRFLSLQDVIYRVKQEIKDEIRQEKLETKAEMQAFRKEVVMHLNQCNESMLVRIHENQNIQRTQLDSFATQLNELMKINDERLERLRISLEQKLLELQGSNQRKLEEIRQTVDEKLNDTLEKRLGESFRLVSERLEQVHKGLGEMQTLAVGVGDLKNVLSNIKTRGIIGEFQLGNLLEQILTVEQYAQNVATVPHSNERVEYAIKLPGRSAEQECVWLPIDAKFPQEDYQRILEAQEDGNKAAFEEAVKALEVRIKSEAKSIHEKYVAVPYTTEFAILFLPIEGLYAEVLKRNGLCEKLMNDYKIVIAGPTTLAALLNSLQMGFRSIAIEKRSSEVWAVLGAVKSEFGKFGDLLDKTHKKLQEATNSIDTAARKTRTIERRLKTVQETPSENENEFLAVE